MTIFDVIIVMLFVGWFSFYFYCVAQEYKEEYARCGKWLDVFLERPLWALFNILVLIIIVMCGAHILFGM